MRFEFGVDGSAPPPSGFDLGHMTVHGSEGTAGSRGHAPDQAMMIHLSLSALLDGLRLLLTERRRAWAFGAVDSSFALHFTLRKDGTLVTRSGAGTGTVIDTSDPGDVAAALAAAAADFAGRHLPTLAPGDAAAQDLSASVADFLAAFGGGPRPGTPSSPPASPLLRQRD